MSGTPVAEAVLADVGTRVATLGRAGKAVGLGTILVGDDPASAHYVARKHEACQRLGIASVDIRIPEQAPRTCSAPSTGSTPTRWWTASWCKTRCPLASTTPRRWPAYSPAKDVDGLHPVNLGYLALGEPGHPRPCTPLGIRAMLAHYQVPVEGRSVVVVGRGGPRPAPGSAPVPQGARGQRRRHRRAHRREGLARAHPAGRHRRVRRRRAQHDHAGRGGAGFVRGRGRHDLGGAQGAVRRRRTLRRGGGLGHPSSRRRGRHHCGHAPGQHRGGGRSGAAPYPLVMATVSELLTAGKTYSFEFFPPKNDAEQARLVEPSSTCSPLRPSFVSVTYRAGPSSRQRTTDLVVLHAALDRSLTRWPI